VQFVATLSGNKKGETPTFQQVASPFYLAGKSLSFNTLKTLAYFQSSSISSSSFALILAFRRRQPQSTLFFFSSLS
jgi:hypothetical protein